MLATLCKKQSSLGIGPRNQPSLWRKRQSVTLYAQLATAQALTKLLRSCLEGLAARRGMPLPDPGHEPDLAALADPSAAPATREVSTGEVVALQAMAARC